MYTKIGLVFILLVLLSSCQSTHHTPDINGNVEQTQVNYHAHFINKGTCSQIIDNEFIVMCYDYQKKAVKAVSYTLSGDLVNEKNIKKRPSFHVEKSLKSEYRTSNSSYLKTGYDKGHMASDASFDWSQESLDAVYTLANIIPQAPKVNRHMWSKLEAYAREKAVDLGTLKVVNVIAYADNYKTLGSAKMAISKGYYKILYNHDADYEACFYYENNLSASSKGDSIWAHRLPCKEVGY